VDADWIGQLASVAVHRFPGYGRHRASSDKHRSVLTQTEVHTTATAETGGRRPQAQSFRLTTWASTDATAVWFDSAYQRGTPVDFPLDGVGRAFRRRIAGQKGWVHVGVFLMTSGPMAPRRSQPALGPERRHVVFRDSRSSAPK